jgi:hypothetical protein
MPRFALRETTHASPYFCSPVDRTLQAQSPWHIVTINVPGALQTQVRGVNNYGEIVGFYRSSTSVPFGRPSQSCSPYLRDAGLQDLQRRAHEAERAGRDQHRDHGGELRTATSWVST